MNESQRRSAFTLIELLVVLGIIALIAGLAIYFIPSFQTSDRSARGAGYLQQWLLASRQRALRDQAPRGLRLLYNASLGAYDRAQYLEQPDDLGGGRSYNSATNNWVNLAIAAPPAPNNTNLNMVWLTDTQGTPGVFNFGKSFSLDQTVQYLDYLEVNGAGLAHAIIDTAESKPGSGIYDVLVLGSQLPAALNGAVTNFRIMRRPRVVGDEILEFPRTIIVDGTTNTTFAATLPFIEALPADASGDVDIMFAPGGAMMPGTTTKPHVIFWVRSTDYATAIEGEPTLIVVYARTGMVAAYPVNPGNPSNPYDLVK